MEYPPQEHLVEKYFHPDNMSAEEKLKLELKKLRDEFIIHESDCGSTRVQNKDVPPFSSRIASKGTAKEEVEISEEN